jgi:hypothetical protein
MAWIDEVTRVVDLDHIASARYAAEQRALVMAIAAGGEPSTERILESVVMALPYGGVATARIRVRATSQLATRAAS